MSTIPCHRGGHNCSWPACPADCDGRPGSVVHGDAQAEQEIDAWMREDGSAATVNPMTAGMWKAQGHIILPLYLRPATIPDDAQPTRDYRGRVGANGMRASDLVQAIRESRGDGDPDYWLTDDEAKELVEAYAAQPPAAPVETPVAWRVHYCGQCLYFETEASAEIYTHSNCKAEPLYNFESQAKEPEASGGLCQAASHAVRVGEASADLPTTSEIMDVTAGRDRQPHNGSSAAAPVEVDPASTFTDKEWHDALMGDPHPRSSAESEPAAWQYFGGGEWHTFAKPTKEVLEFWTKPELEGGMGSKVRPLFTREPQTAPQIVTAAKNAVKAFKTPNSDRFYGTMKELESALALSRPPLGGK